MENKSSGNSNSSNIVLSPRDFFNDLVTDALTKRQVTTFPMVSNYLVDLLEFYVSTDNLFAEKAGKKEQKTLAEMFLQATNAKPPIKTDMFKRLGDTSLYISGFFGDSLKRKVVDIDYYAEIGGTAYSHLASVAPEDTVAKVYSEFSGRFLEFVEVLTYISQKVAVQTNEDLLRLYDRYISTGSELAKEQLLEKGLLTSPEIQKKTRQ